MLVQKISIVNTSVFCLSDILKHNVVKWPNCHGTVSDNRYPGREERWEPEWISGSVKNELLYCYCYFYLFGSCRRHHHRWDPHLPMCIGNIVVNIFYYKWRCELQTWRIFDFQKSTIFTRKISSKPSWKMSTFIFIVCFL